MHPSARPRRLRRTAALRNLVAETVLTPRQLVEPLFVVEGEGVRAPISSLPGCHHLSVDQMPVEAASLREAGIRAVLLFGLPSRKDEQGSSAWERDGVVPRAVRALKSADPELVVVTDVCLCEYTSHGHCGLLRADGSVDNDGTLPALGRTALAHAAAGADLVAPSDMMDGRVAAIRRALDDGGHVETGILSYAAKYASAFYGPFREAVSSTPQQGDRRGYQMDARNRREALREVVLDMAEGADMIMVKPALPYLDVLRAVAQVSDRPVAAYQVSGEYAMIKAASERGWLDEARAVDESLTAIRRAGADIIISYYARTWARWWKAGEGDVELGAGRLGRSDAEAPGRAAAQTPSRPLPLPGHA